MALNLRLWMWSREDKMMNSNRTVVVALYTTTSEAPLCMTDWLSH
jgi:hypothetical protein